MTICSLFFCSLVVIVSAPSFSAFLLDILSFLSAYFTFFFPFLVDSSSASNVKGTMSSNLADLGACHFCAERKMSWSWLKPLQQEICSIDTTDMTYYVFFS